MSSPNPKDNFAQTLADWRVTPPRNPQFRAEVRARLEATRHAPTWSGYLRAHGALVAGALMLALMLGAWTGRVQARDRAAAARAALVADYVHGLDARWMRLP
jgi:anti-sigma factor RsiW